MSAFIGLDHGSRRIGVAVGSGGPAVLGELPSFWYDFAKGTGCPLLAPIAALEDFGATGPPVTQVGTAGGGPFTTWPGDGTPTMFVVMPPLTIGDPELEPFFATVRKLLISQGITQPTAVRRAIEQTAERLGGAPAGGRNDQYGNGLISPARALSGLGFNQGPDD